MSTKNKKAGKQYQLAEKAFRQQNYSGTVSYLKKAVKRDAAFIEAWLLMGDAYRELEMPNDALQAFQKAISIDSTFFPRVYYFTGDLYYQLGDYSNSISQYQEYLSSASANSPVRESVLEALDRAIYAQELFSHPNPESPVNAGPTLNSDADEYINYLSVDEDEIILTRKVPMNQEIQNRMIYEENFYAARKIDGEWQQPKTINTDWGKGLNRGGMNISVDGRKMYFAGCNWPGSFGSCDLYVSFRAGKEWEQPINLGTHVNSQWWDSQPFISATGRQLFFASKRSGGKGDTDLWMAVRLPNGKWSQPVNLGDSINTSGSEMAPFLHPDGRTLYFSSDGHKGLGKYDLFVSRKDKTGRWSKAQNLGYPLNTKDNEINIVVNLKGSTAWLTSDREGGSGNMDMYIIPALKSMAPREVSFVRGTVLDSKTGEVLNAFVELANLKTGMNEDSTFTDPFTGEFLMVLQPEINYAFNISARGYVLYSENIHLKRTDDPGPVEKTFLLSPIVKGERMILRNVYFEFNSAALQPESYFELNKLLQLLRKNPKLRIRVEGHTDNIGTGEYNKKLSEERAKSVVNYLLEKGIAESRLEWEGLGDSMPVASNQTESGRAQNRRTEIVIR